MPSNLNSKQRQAVAVSLSIQERKDKEAGQRLAEHPGFRRAQAQLAKRTNPRTGQPYGKERAGAILAAGARRASPEAKAANPRLRRVPAA